MRQNSLPRTRLSSTLQLLCAYNHVVYITPSGAALLSASRHFLFQAEKILSCEIISKLMKRERSKSRFVFRLSHQDAHMMHLMINFSPETTSSFKNSTIESKESR